MYDRHVPFTMEKIKLRLMKLTHRSDTIIANLDGKTNSPTRRTLDDSFGRTSSPLVPFSDGLFSGRVVLGVQGGAPESVWAEPRNRKTPVDSTSRHSGYY